MSATISQELIFFLKSILTGVLMVFVYDILRIFRRIIKHNTVVIALEDSVYWIVSALVIFMMIYEVNDGAIRGYSIVGILIGVVVYSVSISPLFVGGISFVLEKIIFVFMKIFSVVFAPLRFLGRKIAKLMRFLLKSLKKVVKEVKMIVRKN